MKNKTTKTKYKKFILGIFFLACFAVPSSALADEFGKECQAQGGTCKFSHIGNSCDSKTEDDLGTKDCRASESCCKPKATTTSPTSKADCEKWCDNSGGNADYIKQCKSGCKDTSSTTTPSATANSGGNLKYEPMEEIPGFGRPVDFPTYLMSLYKFGLWAIGLAALLMISIGGFMYVSAAASGNNVTTGNAKSMITDAIIGLLLALTSWIILYVINPELVTFKSLSQILDEAAKSYDGTKYPSVAKDMPKNCNDPQWQEVFSKASASTGVDKCALQALAAIESGCNSKVNRTNGGRDCSVVQIAAQANCGTSCEALEADPQKAVECAAKYLKQCSGKWRNSPEEQKIRDMYAGYNGGCGALNPSSSCAGQVNEYGNPFQKWDCKIDCGGYCPVPGRTSVFLNYYNQCKGQK